MRITIIGPRSVGKTTVAKLLAQKLSYIHEESDKVMDGLLKKHGGLSKLLQDGKWDLVNDAVEKRFDVALQQDDLIFDLAGGALIIEERDLGKRTQEFIRQRSVVIGLLPGEDDAQAVKLLYARERQRDHFDYLDDDELYEKVQRNYAKVKPALLNIAHHIVFVKEKTPQAIVDEMSVFLDNQAKAL